jgi:hypothetical protein
LLHTEYHACSSGADEVYVREVRGAEAPERAALPRERGAGGDGAYEVCKVDFAAWSVVDERACG